jgi:hypothetical protein
MIPKLEERYPEWVGALVARIELAEFDHIVLDARFELLDPDLTGWYSEWFGRNVIDGRARSLPLDIVDRRFSGVRTHRFVRTKRRGGVVARRHRIPGRAIVSNTS